MLSDSNFWTYCHHYLHLPFVHEIWGFYCIQNVDVYYMFKKKWCKTHSTTKDKTPDQTSLKPGFSWRAKWGACCSGKTQESWLSPSLCTPEKRRYPTEKPAPWFNSVKRGYSQMASTFLGLHKVALCFLSFSANSLYAQRMEVSVPRSSRTQVSGLSSSSFMTIACILLCLRYFPCLCFPKWLRLKNGQVLPLAWVIA